MVELVGQIAEEATIFAFEDCRKGLESPNVKFLELTVDLISLALSKHHLDTFESSFETLNKLQTRLDIVTTRKENKVIRHFTLQDVPARDPICEGLWHYSEKLRILCLKFTSVRDYTGNEGHELRHCGLFESH